LKLHRGLIHIHSSFSYDGKNSIQEWAAFLKLKGYDFACFTEHDDDFDQHKMAQLVKECKDISDASFYAVPGLEFRCSNKVHLLGLGVTTYKRADGPIAAAQFIKGAGGLSVLAHPRGYERNITKALLEYIDGIEAWNASKDGRFLPSSDSIQFCMECKRANPTVMLVGGADVHSIESYFPLDVYAINGFEGIKREGINNIRGQYYTMNSEKENSLPFVLGLKMLGFIYHGSKRFRDKLKKMSGN
jgi:predicted metal-dependent phosphoesterase TrpH